jgi:hypothetical protein
MGKVCPVYSADSFAVLAVPNVKVEAKHLIPPSVIMACNGRALPF